MKDRDRELKKTKTQVRSSFDYFFNRLAWSAITAVIGFAALQLNRLSDSVAELTRSMSLVVYQLESVQKQSDEFEQEIDELEKRVGDLEKRNGSRSIRARD